MAGILELTIFIGRGMEHTFHSLSMVWADYLYMVWVSFYRARTLARWASIADNRHALRWKNSITMEELQ